MFDYSQNPMYNPMINPYLGAQRPYQQPPRQEVIKVCGENGARAFQLGPNSSALLLDESGALVWLVTTDGAGYKSVAPFDISPHQATPEPDYGSLEERVKKLEEAISNGSTADTANARAEYTAFTDSSEPAARADQADDRRHEKRR